MIENNYNYLYRDNFLNKISPSFCAAKWYNATIWLNHGMTASCHHPPAHQIPLDQVQKNYKILHNTEIKKIARQQMLNGERPEECEYCWKVEDLGNEYISDRVYKSTIYSNEDILKIKSIGAFEDVDLKTIEIAFDNNCNFACSYCYSHFSSTLQTDIKVKGRYQNLISNGANAFQEDNNWNMPFGRNSEKNPYIEAFWKWWKNDLQYSCDQLRVTGGEVLMSNDFWKLVNWFENNPNCNTDFAINSNLGVAQQLIEKLISASHKFKKIHIYTSNESYKEHSQYIRDGLIWKDWEKNILNILENGKFESTNCMCTINALCLLSLKDFLSWIIELRNKYPNALTCSFNILRSPAFHALSILPNNIREKKSIELEFWLLKNKSKLKLIEIEGLKRTIAYIKEIDQNNIDDIELRLSDFKSFFTQYDARRSNKNFVKTFPELEEWYNSIKILNGKKIIPIYNDNK